MSSRSQKSRQWPRQLGAAAVTSDRLGSAENPLALLNVSMGGALLALFGEDLDFALGKESTPLRLDFILPTGRVSAQCEVRWVDAAAGRIGVRFLSMDEESRDVLRRFVGNGFSGGDLAVGQ